MSEKANLTEEEKIGMSGFPFQKEVEKLLLSNQCDYYPHQTEIPLSVPPEYASSKFVLPSLDIALCYAEHPLNYPPKWSIDLLIECKKAYESDWFFFSKLSGSYYSCDKFPISATTHFPQKQLHNNQKPQPQIKTIFFDCKMQKSPIIAPICDNVLEISNSKHEREVIYEACGTLSLALIHFLENARNSIIHLHEKNCTPDNVTIVFPIIVTTAKLHIIDSEKLSVDLISGKLDKSTIKEKEIDWVLFEFPMSPSIQLKAEPVYVLYDFAKELATKMGCVVVRADKLITFLSKFNANLLMEIAEKFSDERNYVISSF